LNFNSVSEIVGKYFCNSNFELANENQHEEIAVEHMYENNKPGMHFQYREDVQGAKVQYCFSIHDLNPRQICALKLFNLVFGEGTSSILYHEIRTKRGLVYDIGSKIKNEAGIKLFTISLGTSYENVDKTIEIINREIEKVKKLEGFFDKQCILKLCKSYKLRRMLALEKSIQSSMNLCVYEIMYGDGSVIFSEFENMETIVDEEIMQVVKSVLVNATIQILTKNKKE